VGVVVSDLGTARHLIPRCKHCKLTEYSCLGVIVRVRFMVRNLGSNAIRVKRFCRYFRIYSSLVRKIKARETLWIESQQPVEEDCRIKILAAGILNFSPCHPTDSIG